MKFITCIFIVFIGSQALADTITARYPDYNHSKSGACKDAKLYVKNKASNECPRGTSGGIDTECIQCTEKIRFNTPTWTCTGKAKFKCVGKTASEDEQESRDGFGDKAIRGIRGKARQKLGGPCLQFPNSERCRKWKANYQKAVGGVRN